MLEQYTEQVKLAFSEKHPDQSLDTHQINLIRYLIALLVGKRVRNGDIYRFKMISNSIRATKRAKPDELKPFYEAIDLKELTEDKVNMVKEAFISAGFLKTALVFECDVKSHYEEIEDPEDIEFFKDELKKSIEAAKKYQKHTIEYNEIRGKVFHLYSGQEGIDPIEYIYEQERWIIDVELDPNLVNINENDMLKATEEILPQEIKEKIEARAREIAVERLK